MLVTFSTKSYSNIMMFDDIATHLLHMMGHSATIPGAITAEDVPAALGHLRSALQIEGDAPTSHAMQDKETDPLISLRHRALPLVELLENAVKKNADVMWR
ncbi:MAG TPA: DUF1840 domain-containing protein [Methylophilaceae bacterium]|nr:DUF1840 domain-containing protein [Methylophilaceae bacterium]